MTENVELTSEEIEIARNKIATELALSPYHSDFPSDYELEVYSRYFLMEELNIQTKSEAERVLLDKMANKAALTKIEKEYTEKRVRRAYNSSRKDCPCCPGNKYRHFRNPEPPVPLTAEELRAYANYFPKVKKDLEKIEFKEWLQKPGTPLFVLGVAIGYAHLIVALIK
jgi:hypothetical protein